MRWHATIPMMVSRRRLSDAEKRRGQESWGFFNSSNIKEQPKDSSSSSSWSALLVTTLTSDCMESCQERRDNSRTTTSPTTTGWCASEINLRQKNICRCTGGDHLKIGFDATPPLLVIVESGEGGGRNMCNTRAPGEGTLGLGMA